MIRTLRRARALVVAVAVVMAGPATAACGGTAATPTTPTTATPTAATATTATAAAATTLTVPTAPITHTATTGAPSAGPTGPPTAPGAGATSSTTPGQSVPGTVTYGLSDAQGAYARCTDSTPYCCDPDRAQCDQSSMQGYFNDPAFQRLTAPESGHRITENRLFISYDALQEFNGSTSHPGCVYSRALLRPWRDLAGRLHPAGESWRDLLAGLIQSARQGLTPVVSIAGYASPHAVPPWDVPSPDPTTVAGYWEYRCGLQGVLDAVSKLPLAEQPHIWEAFNEPNNYGMFKDPPHAAHPQASSCAVTAQGAPDGPAKAACDYVIGSREIHQFAGHSRDTVIAGVFTRPDAAYLTEYAAQMRRVLPGTAFPQIWAVHDYADVTSAYAGPVPTLLGSFDRALAHDSGGLAHQLWVTEAGTLLTDHQPGGNCPAVGTDAAGSLGACVNGQPLRQATSAAAFLALPDAAREVPITHLFWYQFQSAPHWDSGLVDTNRQPRAGWCAFFGVGTCTGNPAAAS